jgi:hypothetical protein
MPQAKIIRIFLASPGDVQTERSYARTVVEELNRTTGREKGVRFDVIGWDTDSFPSFGSDGQAIVNNQIADMSSYDLFVGIMWNRFGQPTPRAGSGTEEELDLAVSSFNEHGKPNIMFYFNQAPANLSSRAEVEQKMKVIEFKDKIRSSGGLTWDYNGAEAFREFFRNHLTNWLVRQTIDTPEQPAAVKNAPLADSSQQKIVEQVNDSGMWTLLKASFFLAEAVEELDNGSVLVSIIPENTEQDALLKDLQANSRLRNEPIPFAHQNSAGLAKVLAAERQSSSGRAIWKIRLKLDSIPRGIGTEMVFNNISVDEIAEMRARVILLNEKPAGDQRVRGSDMFLQAIVSGVSTSIKATQSVIPELWRHFKGVPEEFLPLARLWAVFHLITSNTCEHVLELTVGPLRSNKLYIRFRGRRHKTYSNVEPTVIEVEGECDLPIVSV